MPLADMSSFAKADWTVARAAVAAAHLALHLLPVAIAWRHLDLTHLAGDSGEPPLPQEAFLPLWLVSAAILATAVRWLWEDGGVCRRLSALALSTLLTLAGLLLLISFVAQGTALNIQFFFHANWQTVVVASKVFAAPFFLLWAYWLVVNAWLCLLPRRRQSRRRTGTVVGIAVLAVALNAPLLSFVWFVATETMAMRQALLVPKPPHSALLASLASLAPLAPTPSKQPTNLVFLFAEGLEDTFGDAVLFGSDTTPRLTALTKQGLRFTNMRQVSRTGWTTGAFIAAQCALPLGPAAHGTSLFHPFDFDARMPDASCLGDLLVALGYRTVYMGGAGLAFGGKGAFLDAHGYEERHGLETLRPQLADPNYVSGWGIFDDSLFALALDKLIELEQGDAPYLLTLLTLDTHSPDGFPSASCGKPDPNAGKLFVVRCADRLIADFIAAVRNRYPQTLIVLFSDHLIPVDSALSHKLSPFAPRRRLRFVAWGPDVAAGTLARRGTHFDVVPTVLDLLGVPNPGEHNLGASLLRHESPWFAHPHAKTLRFVHRLPELRLASGDEVTFDPMGPTLEIGGQRFLATGHGLALKGAVFALRYDEKGQGADIRHFHGPGAYEAFTAWVANGSAIGISTQPIFNRKLTKDENAPATIFFAGRVDALDASQLVAGSLHTRRTVALP